MGQGDLLLLPQVQEDYPTPIPWVLDQALEARQEQFLSRLLHFFPRPFSFLQLFLCSQFTRQVRFDSFCNCIKSFFPQVITSVSTDPGMLALNSQDFNLALSNLQLPVTLPPFSAKTCGLTNFSSSLAGSCCPRSPT